MAKNDDSSNDKGKNDEPNPWSKASREYEEKVDKAGTHDKTYDQDKQRGKDR